MQSQNKENISQKDLVLNHLKAGFTITPLEALGEYSIYRLAAIIKQLRYEGWKISTEIKRSVRQRPYAQYSLVGGRW